jgi:hypothetical protein
VPRGAVSGNLYRPDAVLNLPAGLLEAMAFLDFWISGNVATRHLGGVGG